MSVHWPGERARDPFYFDQNPRSSDDSDRALTWGGVLPGILTDYLDEGELLGGGGELHSVRIQAAAGWAREANHILAPGTEANQPKLM